MWALGLAGVARAEPPTPERLGPVEVEVGPDRLRLSFMGQARLTYLNEDGEGTERVTLQRVRPVLVGAFLERRLKFRLHLNTGPTALELLDLFAEYRFSPRVRLRIGQQKIPFTRHRWQSFSRQTLVDWSPTARAFGAERQIGVLLHDGAGALDGFEYAVGVFTGDNARSAFERGLAAAYGVPLDNPSRLDDPAAPARVHPELVARVGWDVGQDPFHSDSDALGGPLRLAAALSAAWDLRPEVAEDFAVRVAPEVLLKAYGWSMSAQGYLGVFERSTDGALRLGALGAFLQTGYRFFGRYEVAGRYSWVEHLEALRDDAAARAADLGGAALGLSRTQEVALGFNVYIVGHSLKWQTDVALLLEDPGGEDVRVRSQLQVMF